MKWEYKTIKLHTKGLWGGKFDASDLDSSMNKLGDQGWELVTSFAISGYKGEASNIVAIF